MTANIRTQLLAAAKSNRLVRLSRRFEKSAVRGYVLDVGPEFFLLLLVSDRIWFDGFECLRVADIRSVALDKYSDFAEAALRKRRARRPEKPAVSVQRRATMVAEAGAAFPLVAIHEDEDDPEVCWIGRVLEVHRGRVTLHEVDPHAKWHEHPRKFRLAALTRLSFGGDYEGALHLVAGDPAATPLAHSRKPRRRASKQAKAASP